MKNTLLTAIALGSMGLAACSGEKPPEETGPEVVKGLSETNGRMVLPAVSGNPAVVYFDLAYNGDKGIALRGAEVKGAKSAMLHDTMEWAGKMEMSEMTPLAMQKGDSVSFEPGGKHIMVNEPGLELTAGSKTDVTLIFAGGDTYSFPVEIHAAGDER